MTQAMTRVIKNRIDAGTIRGPGRACGNDRWDEVWDDVYVLMPNPDVDHQGIAGGLIAIIGTLVDWPGRGTSYQGVNVTDSADDWTQNFRCPDVAVYLKGNPAVNLVDAWCGGPDFAVDIVCPNDRSREKLDFYARVGVRELLLIDRDPWALELYRRRGAELALAAISSLDRPEPLASDVIPLRLSLADNQPPTSIEVSTADGSRRWRVRRVRNRTTRARLPAVLPINLITDWPSFIEQVRRRPGLWLGSASVTGLRHLINGIEFDEHFYDVPEEKCFSGFSFADFEDWVEPLFNPERLSVDSFWLARQATESEEAAFALWLDWYDQFRGKP